MKRSPIDNIARAISGTYLDRLVGPVLDRGLANGALDPDDLPLARTQLILLLRHLAAAPFQPGEDPTLDRTFHSEDRVRETAQKLGRAYLRAWTARNAARVPESSATRSVDSGSLAREP